jgi:CarboxypepD_reg-like domain/TonB-dependent Receptor Plug Domain
MRQIATKAVVLIFLFVSFSTLLAQGQTGIIKGFVYDKNTGEPLIYTNVIIKNSNTGVQTDVNGYFSLTLPNGSYTLFVTALGYDSLSVEVNLLPNTVVTKKLLISPRETELKGVEVSARKTEQLTHVNTGVTTITPHDLKVLPSAGGEPDLAQYLQVIPGVVFTGDQGGQLYIRGGSPSQTGIYLDGVTIWNPFHTIGLYSVFETDAIRNADVYSAGFNAQYGNRTSAIIDVHTKDGNKNEIAGLVSVSPIMSRVVLEGPLVKSKKDNGSGITFLVTGKTSYLDSTSKWIYGGFGKPYSKGLPYRFTDLYGKVTFSGDNGSKLNLFAFNFDDHSQLLNDTSFAKVADFHWTATGGGATFVVSPGNSSTLIDGKFAYSRYNIALDNYEFVNTDSLPNTSEIDGFEAAINFTNFLPNYSELKYGLEISGYHTSLSYYSASGIQTENLQESTIAGLYAVYRKNFGSKFIFEPGIRFQYYSDLAKFSPEPRIGLKYNVSNNVRLKFATGLYSENIVSTKSDQDIVNFFTGFSLSPGQQIKNVDGNTVSSNLQTAYHAVGGIEVDVDRVTFNLEPWYKNFPQIDELNRDKHFTSDADFIAANGSAYGIDLSGKYNHDRIYFWGAVGYQNVQYTSIDANGNKQTYPPPFDTRVNVNVVASYTAGKKKDWDLAARFSMHAPFPFTQTQGFYAQNNVLSNGLQTNYLVNNGPLGLLYANSIDGGRLSYYHRLDLSARKRIAFSKKVSLDVTFAITNVYDRKNIFYVDRFTNVKVYQLPVFPSLNLTLNF